MRPRRSRLRGLTFAVVSLAALAVALPASASAGNRVLYADGHPLDTTRLATFGGNTETAQFDGCSDTEWANALARTDFDVLVVGENAAGCGTPLTATTLTSIGDYVRGGKPIVFTGAHANEDDFMNAIFGFSMSNVSDSSSETLVGTLQSSAAGTPFAGGPATLTDPSATELESGTPGTAIYTGPEGTWAFTANVGSGVVTFLGWDFCCGSDPVMDDWYRVLDRALQVRPPSAAAPSDMCLGRKATIIGTPGDDVLSGTPKADVIVGLGGKDKLNGLGGDDVICGRTGKDKLKGGAGDDKLQGNKGNDRLIGNGGTDLCRGGMGKDSASSCEVEKGL